MIQRERPAKDIQIFAPGMENLRQAAAAALSNLPSGAMASLYQTKETRVDVVRAERVEGKVRLVSVELGPIEKAEKEKEKAHEADK